MAAKGSSATIIFDDGQGDLGPLSDLRACFEQRTGGHTLLERARAHGMADALAVPAAMAPMLAARHGCAVNDAGAASGGDVLFLNGRIHVPLGLELLAGLRSLAAGEALCAPDGTVLAACLRSADATRAVTAIAAGTAGNVGATGTAGDAAAAGSIAQGCQKRPTAAAHWRRPWDLLDATRFGALLVADIETVAGAWRPEECRSLPAGSAHVGAAALHLHASASIGAGCIFDTTEGPILVSAGAQVRHGAVITGPAFIGAKCIVGDRAVLKPRTALGPQCRANGEIGSVIFQGCSNKAHEGHLGDALVGEWVNLGASTVNSNLLNTYGEVTMRLRPASGLERTGRQFMGCLLGDHAKTAIGTRIMTGSSIGTGAMWAATAPITGTVDAFAWATDDGRRRYRLDKFMEVARTVMARRGVVPDASYAARIAALHAAEQGSA